MENCGGGDVTIAKRDKFSLSQCPMTYHEIEVMNDKPYASSWYSSHGCESIDKDITCNNVSKTFAKYGIAGNHGSYLNVGIRQFSTVLCICFDQKMCL